MADTLAQCYNKGCGQKFNIETNTEDSCCHHPGEPVFHDAYKGWSCCNKKCIDFTEFLNIKGCTRSKHSNIKPPEPEKPVRADVNPHEVIEVKPIIPVAKTRPPFDTPLIEMKPDIAPSLKQQVVNAPSKPVVKVDPNNITVGTVCKNGGCNVSYEGPDINNTICTHHPGYPVFHEGLKFWTCCQKKTSDFNAFLNQVGCTQGQHVWIKDDEDSKSIQCRWDYHQTATHVVVAIYAKEYCAHKSSVRLNPVRLCANLVFPQQSNATFQMDLELKGIVDVEASQVSMYGSKVEIKLKKAEPGSWARLDIPRAKENVVKPAEEPTPPIEDINLDDL